MGKFSKSENVYCHKMKKGRMAVMCHMNFPSCIAYTLQDSYESNGSVPISYTPSILRCHCYNLLWRFNSFSARFYNLLYEGFGARTFLLRMKSEQIFRPHRQ